MRPKYFIFIGYLGKYEIASAKRTPHTFINMNPLCRNPGATPVLYTKAEAIKIYFSFCGPFFFVAELGIK